MTVVSDRFERKHLIYRMIDGILRNGFRMLPVGRASEAVALWWGYRFRPIPSVARLRSGLRMNVNSVDHLQLLIYYLGSFEPRLLWTLRQIVRPGSTIIDVGANVGAFALEAAMATGPGGRVIAIEACPAHVASLRDNLELNAIGNVASVELAVGDVSGEATMVQPTGGNLGMMTLGAAKGIEAQRVIVRPLDQVLEEQGVDRVDIIKMDVEGSEYRALRGAARILAEDQPTVLIELNETALRGCGSSCAAVKALLRDAGYRGWIIARNEFRPILDAQASHDCDECLFVHRDKISIISGSMKALGGW